MITPHFARSELRLPDPSGPEIERRATALCAAVLEPWRRRVGRLRVTSGWRSVERNTELGGDPQRPGQHTTGDAADVYPLDMPIRDAWRVLVEGVRSGWCPVDQAILEYGDSDDPTHIHVSHVVHRDPRRQLLVERLGTYADWGDGVAASGVEAAIGTTTGLRATE